MAEQLVDDAAGSSSAKPLVPWVVEGKIDLPVQLPKNAAGAATNALYLFLGGPEFDGFVELRPMDRERASKSVFWTQSTPLEYRLRAGVRAPTIEVAVFRGAELMEHVADRLAFMAGEFVRPLSLGFVYNEDQLRECIAGRLQEFDATTGGEAAFRTHPIRNGIHAQRIVTPRPEVLTALRWFRRGMSFQEKVDQFVAFYIALESIAEHLPGVEVEQRACKNCGFKYAASKASAGIALLLKRYPAWPPDSRQILARLRARIVHGNADEATRYNAASNSQAVQRLAADGIAMVLGVDPAQINFGINPLGGLGGLQPAMLPMLRGKYEEEHSPLKAWEGRFLGDVLRGAIEETAAAAQRANAQ